MAQLWLISGDYEAPGWKTLRKDSEDEKVEVVQLDPMVWALVRSDEAPGGYEGLSAANPPDGMYVDPNGSALFVVDSQIASDGPMQVVRALGPEAEKGLEKLGDPVLVLERMGRAY
jgi:hypothetical protein